MITLNTLENIIKDSWCAETSMYDDWGHGAYGQCSPTALIIQDYMGGDIGYTTVFIKGEVIDKHFFNIFTKVIYDFTYTQFSQVLIRNNANYSDLRFGPLQYVNRNALLRVPNIKIKYNLLKEKVNERLNNLYA